MKRPNLNSNQYVVGHAEYSTGHILKIDKTVHLKDGEVFLVFDLKDDAMAYIKKTVNENPDIECWMENSLGARHNDR